MDEIIIMLDELYKEYGSYIRKISEYKLKAMPDKIDDCVHNVIVTLLEALRNGEEIQHYKTWLTVTTNNMAKDIIHEAQKARKTAKKIIKEYSGDLDTTGYYEIELFRKSEREIYALKNQVVDSLTADEKKLLNDKYVLEKTYDQIADEYGMEKNAVYQKIFRLNRKIKAKVKKLLEDQ